MQKRRQERRDKCPDRHLYQHSGAYKGTREGDAPASAGAASKIWNRTNPESDFGNAGFG